MPWITRKAPLTGLAALLLLSAWFQPSFLRPDIESVRYRAISKVDSVVRRINPQWDVRAWVPSRWFTLPRMCDDDDIQYFPIYEEFLLPERISEPGEPYDPVP